MYVIKTFNLTNLIQHTNTEERFTSNIIIIGIKHADKLI